MGKNFKLTIAAVLMAFTGVAQNIHYIPVETNPDLYSRTVFNLGILGFSAGNEVTMGGSVKLETMIGLKVAPYIGYRNTFNSINGETAYENSAVPADGLRKNNHFEIGGSYFFYDKNNPCDVRVYFSSKSNRSNNITYRSTIPSEMKRMVGVSCGYFSERTISKFKPEVSKYYTFTNLRHIIPGTSSNLPDIFIQSNTPSVFLGAKYRRVKRTNIQVENYGKAAYNATTEVYFDLSRAIIVDAKDISFPDSYGASVPPGRYYVIVKDEDITNYGFRLGITHQTAKKRGSYSNFEIGKQAGLISTNTIFGHGFYVRFMFGISFGWGKYIRLGEPIPSKISDTPAKTKKQELHSI